VTGCFARQSWFWQPLHPRDPETIVRFKNDGIYELSKYAFFATYSLTGLAQLVSAADMAGFFPALLYHVTPKTSMSRLR
jgi:hypothetical protein